MIIGGGRRCGKTVELIRIAKAEDLYILCSNKRRAEGIYRQARDMGLEIRYPITASELPMRTQHVREVLVDEMEDVLQMFIGKPIHTASTSFEMKPMERVETKYED